MHKKFYLSTVIIILVSAASCSTAIKAKSTTPVDNRSYKSMGTGAGTDHTWSLFGLWMWGRPDIDEAINEALAPKNGDAMINVVCNETTVWFLFASISRIKVEGEIIKFTNSAGGRKNETDGE